MVIVAKSFIKDCERTGQGFPTKMTTLDIEEIARREKAAIIGHREGPAIVIAGPGTGKTSVLAERIVSLCAESSPERILSITFTNNAADEMREKVSQICRDVDREKYEPKIGTLHSLAKGLLHRYFNFLNISASFRVIEKQHEKTLLEDLRHDLKTQKRNLGRYQDRYLKRFKASKAFMPNSLVDAIVRVPYGVSLATQQDFNDCYSALLEYYSSIDWYDVLALAVELLSHESVLEQVANSIDHLLVDEYQDLNRADHRLINLLSSRAKSLMVFGDDDQSIYETGRFAYPGGIKEFFEIYPNAKCFPLSICWRCRSKILDASWTLVDVEEAKLPDRKPKQKPITDPKRGAGEVRIECPKSEKAEIQRIGSEIENELLKSTLAEDILVLFHGRAIGKKYAEALQKSLEKRGIRIDNQIVIREPQSEAATLFYEIIRLLNNESDNLAARSIFKNILKINSNAIGVLRIASKKNGKSLWRAAVEATSDSTPIKSMDDKFKRWRDSNNIGETLKEIMTTFEILNQPEIDKIRDWCIKENVGNLANLIKYLDERLDSDLGFQPGTSKETTSKITFMTMHSAKGLTSDVVFIPALEDELMPNNWYEPEQRRLLYVSMTRARSRLFLSYAWSRSGRVTYRGHDRSIIARKCSRFLIEIKKKTRR